MKVGIIVDQPIAPVVRVGPAIHETPLLAASGERNGLSEAAAPRPLERLVEGRDVEVLYDATALAPDPQGLILENERAEGALVHVPLCVAKVHLY